MPSTVIVLNLIAVAAAKSAGTIPLTLAYRMKQRALPEEPKTMNSLYDELSEKWKRMRDSPKGAVSALISVSSCSRIWIPCATYG